MSDNKKDFFISYTKADKDWAQWIAHQLEKAGYTTIIQAWDFRPGSNFILEIDKATKQAQRTIAVLSQSYLQAVFTQPEWAAAFRQDPAGQRGTLLPVRVEECQLGGLFAAIGYIDLVNLDEDKARTALLRGIIHERVLPPEEPRFPGRRP